MSILRLLAVSFTFLVSMGSLQAESFSLATSVTICCVETTTVGDTSTEIHFLIHGDTYQEASQACFDTCDGQAGVTCAVASIRECNGARSRRQGPASFFPMEGGDLSLN